ASLVLVAPFIVIAGIVGGLFTATESAGIACVYALVLGLGIYRTLGLRDPTRPWLILVALNVLLLILGCLMDSLAILLIITPMILPIALRAGIDPVHLGVVMAVNLSIGLITPPFGSAMFVLMGIR